jgi:hypothetical protein
LRRNEKQVGPSRIHILPVKKSKWDTGFFAGVCFCTKTIILAKINSAADAVFDQRRR